MSKCYLLPKIWLKAIYLLHDKETGAFVQSKTMNFYSRSKVARNLNDIAARYARDYDIKWDKLIVRNVWGETLSQRTRMFYNQ